MANASDGEDKKPKAGEGGDDGGEDDDIDLDLDEDEDDSDEGDDDPADKDDKKKGNDDRKKETPDQKVARLKRELSRAEKKAGKGDDEGDKSKAPSKDNKKSGELDYGEKAFLVANGIKGKKETALVMEYAAETGKSIEDILESKHFQNDLKDLREDAGTKGAIPKGTRRSGNSSNDTVEYWIAKGEMPPNTPENRDLRTKIVNAKIKAKQSGSVFTDQPVVGG